MTARPCYDWTPVGYGSHPIPGDADEVAQGAREFRQTAGYLRTAASGLERLESQDDTISEAVDALDHDMRQVISTLWSALDRYETAAGALDAYAPVLLRAQEQAEAALQAATEARREMQQSASTARHLYQQYATTLDPHRWQEITHDIRTANARTESANASYTDATRRIQDAIHLRDAAGDRAAALIQDSIDDSSLNDSLADRLKELVGDIADFVEAQFGWAIDPIVDALKFVWDHIDEISLALTLLALATAWIPGVDAVTGALATAANAVALIKGAIQLESAVVRGDWNGVVEYGIGVALSFVGAKAASGLLRRVSRGAFRSLARESVRETGSYRTATNALRDGVGTPDYHPAHKFLNFDEPLDPRAVRRADQLVATFKGTDLTPLAKRDAIVIGTANKEQAYDAVKEVIKHGLDQGKQPIADAIIPDSPDSATGAPADYRVCRQPVGGGW